MPQVKVNEDICLYISNEDFLKLVTQPDISENDINFKEVASLKSILSEFGY